MNPAQDILLDEDGELKFRKGDLHIGPSDYQHMEDIIYAAPGHYKQFPLIGANAKAFINGNYSQDFQRIISLMLESDGYSINSILFENDKLSIDAKRK